MSENTDRPGEGVPEDLDIDLSAEDLEAEPDEDLSAPPGVALTPTQYSEAPPGLIEPPAPLDEDTLVIDTEDLADVEDALPLAGPGAVGQYPTIDPMAAVDGYAPKKGKGEMLAGGLVGSLLLQMMLAGALGGFLAWLFTEPSTRASELRSSFLADTPLQQLIHTGVFGAALGAFVGLALGAVEGIVISAWQRAATGGGLGFLIGGAGGAVGGVVGQLVFSALIHGGALEPGMQAFLRTTVARALGWALVGAFVGLGPGIMMMAPKRIINGIIGGAAGGLVGGFLFDPINVLFGMQGVLAGTPSRLVGIVVTGLCTGLGVGLVEEIRKEAWLLIISGPLEGKQFILYKPVTWIGSASGMDIPLVKDSSIAPKQCALEHGRGGHLVRDVAGAGTYVNGLVVSEHRLTDGDIIQIGQTGLQYNTRPYASGPYVA